MDSNKKIAHLQMLQNIINRFSSNSFTWKGLCFTLIIGMLSFYKESLLWLVILIINLTFWFLDSYYLRQERYYRAIYNKVCLFDEENIDFFMGSKEENNKYPYKKDLLFKVMFSVSMLPYIIIFSIGVTYLIIKLYIFYVYLNGLILKLEIIG